MEYIEHCGLRIMIDREYGPENPRTFFDNVGSLLLFSKRSVEYDELNCAFRPEQFGSFDEMADALGKEYPGALIVPLYVYEHGSIYYKLGSFEGLLPQGHARFDSWQCGFMICTREKMLSEFGKKRITKEIREKTYKHMGYELETYNAYCNGDVFWWMVQSVAGESLLSGDDSCGMYYEYSAALQDAKQAAERLAPIWFASAPERAAAAAAAILAEAEEYHQATA
jgi:hypothetical protein